MANGLSDDLRKILLAGIGAVAITSEKSKDLINTLVKKGELTVEEGKVLNEELKHNIKEKIKESVTVTVVKGKDTADSVEAVIDNLDSMSKKEIEQIKGKLEEIEKAWSDGKNAEKK